MQALKCMIFAAGLAGAALSGLSPSAHAGNHDGQWSVLVITEKGTCDRGYRYSVRVVDGRLSYDGDAAVNMAGTVAPSGLVKVSIRMGNQGANGSGHLDASSGAGTWQGAGSNGTCAGRWEAERR